jgi:Flp pilus assembly protein CpaB
MSLTDRIPLTARHRLRVLAWRARRPLAALCAGLAVLLAVERVRPPDPPTVDVPVAARDLPPGTALTDADVELREVPEAIAPEPLRQVRADLAGRRTAVAVPEGLPLVAALLADESATGPPGTVVVPVRFADAGVAGVLRPGMRVDVVAAAVVDGAEPVRLASGAVVLAGTGDAADDAEDDGDGASGGGGLLGGGRTMEDDVPVLLAVTPEESVHLGGATGSRVLGAVIVG